MTPTVTLTLDLATARLSDSVRATLAIEGSAPLIVSAPKDVLAGPAAEAWRVRPAGPAATEKLSGDRERWVQAYRLDPYVPGDAVPVAFAPFEVSAGGGPVERIEPTPQVVHVQTALNDPKAADARPITGVEDPPPAHGVDGTPVVFVVAVAGVLLLSVAAAFRRRKRQPAPPTPAAWAGGEFARLELELAAETITPAAFAERLADVLRTFLERRDGLPATKRTTGELSVAESPTAGGVVPVLERCDLAKFAAAPPTAVECQDLLGRARAVITREGAADVGT
jgi:hypothetical protein